MCDFTFKLFPRNVIKETPYGAERGKREKQKQAAESERLKKVQNSALTSVVVVFAMLEQETPTSHVNSEQFEEGNNWDKLGAVHKVCHDRGGMRSKKV